jgi:hypothetical protein
MYRLIGLLTALFAAILLVAATAHEPDQAAKKERLSKLQSLVGSWQGVAQPQRGSTKDSWIEQADWQWKFSDGGSALTASLPKAKFFRQFKLTAGEKEGQFVLLASPAADGSDLRYLGQLDDQEQLVLTAEQPREGLPERLSFRFAAGGDRLLVLLERKSPASGQLTRLAEIGYTRQGSGFGKGTGGRECVVTGGLGTIEVTHKGKTYYVCCTGCRDYFYEKPDEILADYFARKEAEKKK